MICLVQEFDVARMPRNMLVPWYLMSAYAYYHLFQSPMSDGAFDALCVRLDREWGDVAHPHFSLIDRESVQAGSCFLRAEQFPLRVQLATESFLSMVFSGEIRQIMDRWPQALPIRRVGRTRSAR